MSLEILLDQSSAHPSFNTRVQSAIVDGKTTTSALQVAQTAVIGQVLAAVDTAGNVGFHNASVAGITAVNAADGTMSCITDFKTGVVSVSATGNFGGGTIQGTGDLIMQPPGGVNLSSPNFFYLSQTTGSVAYTGTGTTVTPVGGTGTSGYLILTGFLLNGRRECLPCSTNIFGQRKPLL